MHKACSGAKKRRHTSGPRVFGSPNDTDGGIFLRILGAPLILETSCLVISENGGLPGRKKGVWNPKQ